MTKCLSNFFVAQAFCVYYKLKYYMIKEIVITVVATLCQSPHLRHSSADKLRKQLCEDTISPVLRMDCVISRHGTMLITLLELLPSWFTCICTGMRSFSSST